MVDANATFVSHPAPTDFMGLFELSLLRYPPDFVIGPKDLPKLNIGSGFKLIDGTIALDLPDYDANTMLLPYDDETVGTIYALGMLDHIRDVPKFLADCQRVLAPGGVLNIFVPYYSSNMAAEDLYHFNRFTENTWKVLFHNKTWDNGVDWKFSIGLNIICGVVERNMSLITQLIRTA